MRPLSYHWPIIPFRSRLLPWTNGLTGIPDGELLATHYGIKIRSHRDSMYKSIYHFGDYEPFNTKIYRRLIHNGDVVLDIGANFGWYSTLFAKWTGPTGRVHAFEPVPFIHEYAKEALELNGCENRVSLNFFGLGREAGEFTVYTFKGLPHGHATATDLGREDAVPHKCRIETLDDYVQCRALSDCSFLKIDVEGHELEVFQGARSFLSAPNAPIIAFEFNADCLRSRGIAPMAVIEELQSSGYDNFFTFSVRDGFTRVDKIDGNIYIDCLAFKEARRDQARAALATGRMFR